MFLVFVSGASSGIGAALLEHLDGDHEVATISRTDLDRSNHLAVDLGDPRVWPEVERWMEEIVGPAEADSIVFFHLAATLDPIGFAAEVEADRYTSNVLLNSAAPQVLGAAFIRLARRAGIEAVLVQISSGAATKVYPGWSSYCAAKAAVDHWVRVVGAEESARRSGIRVLSVAPGVVATGMQERIREVSASSFPRVQRFRDLHREGQLRPAGAVASELWTVANDASIENGSVLDLRDR